MRDHSKHVYMHPISIDFDSSVTLQENETFMVGGLLVIICYLLRFLISCFSFLFFFFFISFIFFFHFSAYFNVYLFFLYLFHFLSFSFFIFFNFYLFHFLSFSFFIFFIFYLFHFLSFSFLSFSFFIFCFFHLLCSSSSFFNPPHSSIIFFFHFFTWFFPPFFSCSSYLYKMVIPIFLSPSLFYLHHLFQINFKVDSEKNNLVFEESNHFAPVIAIKSNMLTVAPATRLQVNFSITLSDEVEKFAF